jgi:hypothetical protein
VPVLALQAFNNASTHLLRAATHGRGVWQTTLASGVTKVGALAVTPGVISFGSQSTGTASGSQTITISASGIGVAISSIVTSSTQEFPLTTNCPATLPVGSTCTIKVGFVPSLTGARTGTITVVSNGTGTPQRIALTGTGTSTSGPAVPQSGWWWDSKLNGTGFFIEYGGKSAVGMFVGGFLYDASGNDTWLVSTGPMSGSTYTSTWIKTGGGQTLTGPYKAPSQAAAGNVTIAFSDSTHAVMTRPDGTQVNLQRFSFSSTSTPASPVAGAPQSGWWWAGSALSGTGYGIEIQGNAVFIVAYVYDASGNPVWYLATGGLSSPTSYSGTWQLYSGGPQLTSPEGTYTAKPVTGSDVAMSLTFTDATHGTLTMGSVTIPIVRFQEF